MKLCNGTGCLHCQNRFCESLVYVDPILPLQAWDPVMFNRFILSWDKRHATGIPTISPDMACLFNMLKPYCADLCCLANQKATSGVGLIKLLSYPATGPTMDPAFLPAFLAASLALFPKGVLQRMIYLQQVKKDQRGSYITRVIKF